MRPRDTGDATESAFAVPAWARDVGRWSWILVGIGLVVCAAVVVLAATRLLVLAVLFAVLIGGAFLPVVDWLERYRLRRWMGAMLVVALSLVIAVLIGVVIVYGLIQQVPTIEETIDDALAWLNDALGSTDTSADTVDAVKSGVKGLLAQADGGLASAVGTVVGAVGSLLFGVFISINIGVWVLIQGRQLGAWASRHLGPVPQPVAYRIIANSTRFFRGYLWGSTIVGLFNAAVLGVGALVVGVPMAGTIAIVAWVMNYIPYIGAVISGAFTVLIALGAGGPSKAIPMLVIVIIANGFLQTLVSQFALGSALELHPLAVLFATTAGGILFGAVGGVFAGPFLKIALDAHRLVGEAGLFGPVAPASGVSHVEASAPGSDRPPGPVPGQEPAAAPAGRS